MKKLFFTLIIAFPFIASAQIDIDDQPAKKEAKKSAQLPTDTTQYQYSYDMNDPYHHAVWQDVRSTKFKPLYQGQSETKTGYLFTVPISKSSLGEWITPDLQWNKSIMGYVMESDGAIKLVRLEFEFGRGSSSNWEEYLQNTELIQQPDKRITYKYTTPYPITVKKMYKKGWAGPRYIVQ